MNYGSGCNVAVNYAGSKEAAEAVVAEIEGMGAKAIAVQADTSSPEQVLLRFCTMGKGLADLKTVLTAKDCVHEKGSGLAA